MTSSPLRVAYLTAGAAGMYCGSCMHDNTLARALSRRGVDIQLIPAYTPILTDEENVSSSHVVFNGVKIYLQQRFPPFRHLPSFFDRLLESKWLIEWATARGLETDGRFLGALTVSMLKGDHGHQRKEVDKLCRWLADTVRPDLVVLSNILIGGCAPAIKQSLGVPVLATLQGDDIFLDELIEPHRSKALAEIRRIADDIDGFIVNSRYYADYMSTYLGVAADKFFITPLGIDTADFQSPSNSDGVAEPMRAPTVGYLARLAPEKGLHVLVDAFIELRQRPGMEQAQLRVAGWLGGKKNRGYAEQQFQKLNDAAVADAFRYLGAVDRTQKLQFLQQIDVLSVPTIYHEPKGLFVLEALAAGVPVVQPEHGAFPEMLAATGGGRLAPPNNAHRLADVLHELLTNKTLRNQLGREGQANVHANFNADVMADAALAIYQQCVSRAKTRPQAASSNPV